MAPLMSSQTVRSGTYALFLSQVEYRPKTNTAVLWKTSHTKGRSHLRDGKKKEVKKVNRVDVIPTQE
jgi:hypothetical protein